MKVIHISNRHPFFNRKRWKVADTNYEIGINKIKIEQNTKTRENKTYLNFLKDSFT